jgi:hypothetical protein
MISCYHVVTGTQRREAARVPITLFIYKQFSIDFGPLSRDANQRGVSPRGDGEEVNCNEC